MVSCLCMHIPNSHILEQYSSVLSCPAGPFQLHLRQLVSLHRHGEAYCVYRLHFASIHKSQCARPLGRQPQHSGYHRTHPHAGVELCGWPLLCFTSPSLSLYRTTGQGSPVNAVYNVYLVEKPSNFYCIYQTLRQILP